MDELRLCGIGLEPALGNERAIALSDAGHWEGGPRLIRAMAIVS